MILIALVIVILNIAQCSSSLPHCKENLARGTLCKVSNSTDLSVTPEPWPLTIYPFILINQIGSIGQVSYLHKWF